MRNILEKFACTGCNACFNSCPVSAIHMIENAEGFKYPQIDSDKCIKCGLCEKICPAINKRTIKEKNIKSVYAVSANDKIREKSSSGGVFTLLANYFLENQGYVCGASFNRDYSKVKHIIINKKEDLYKLQSSKYVQSDIGLVFKDIKALLQENKKVLFSGTPCQVEGLKRFLNKEYANLLTVDVLCHGAPSPKVWREYLKEISQDKEIKEITFRDKKNGWQGPLLLNIQYKNNTHYKAMSNVDAYYQAFLKNLILRKSCETCQFTNLDRPSDITLGDFWGIGKFNRKLNDRKGLSVVVTNSSKGKEIISKINHKFIIYKEVPVKFAIKGNPVFKTPCKTHKERESFFIKIKRNCNIIKALNDSLNNKYDGVITNFWYAYANYGAVLTAYAIQQLFRERGFDFRLLNYNPDKNTKNWQNSFAKDFAKKYLYFTEEIKSKKDLVKLNFLTDTFVVGSDQIFRDGYLCKNSDISFFTFSDFSKKRVAFSASFGTDSIERGKENIPSYSRALKRFDSITIRETSGVNLCKKTLGVEAKHLLDPVFLLDLEKFDKIIDFGEKKYQGKIVSYVLDISTDLNKKFKKLEKSTGLEVINLARGKLSAGEFLKAIKDCEIFLTDSFHGTCFALLYHKKFLALKNESRGAARFDSLIETFNIQNAFISNIKDFNIEKIEQNKIDWTKFENRIQKEKNDFENWFDKTFNEPKNATIEQITNEFDFQKYKKLKEHKQKEKIKLSKLIFSIQKKGKRKTIIILGVRINLKY